MPVGVAVLLIEIRANKKMEDLKTIVKREKIFDGE